MGTEKHLIEVKNNSDLVKKGIWKQLKKYLEDENIKFGTLLVLVYSDKELIKLKKISNSEFNINKEVRIKLEIIDARKNKILCKRVILLERIAKYIVLNIASSLIKVEEHVTKIV
jgi:hypothetical protein